MRTTEEHGVGRFAHWTLDQLTKQFGTAVDFSAWLDARRRIADVDEKELKISERRGVLIRRDYVARHVFAHIDDASKRLLQDASQTIAHRVYALANAGSPVEEAVQLVRKQIGRELAQARTKALHALQSDADSAEAAE
jgi:hypothetical protein